MARSLLLRRLTLLPQGPVGISLNNFSTLLFDQLVHLYSYLRSMCIVPFSLCTTQCRFTDIRPVPYFTQLSDFVVASFSC